MKDESEKIDRTPEIVRLANMDSNALLASMKDLAGALEKSPDDAPEFLFLLRLILDLFETHGVDPLGVGLRLFMMPEDERAWFEVKTLAPGAERKIAAHCRRTWDKRRRKGAWERYFMEHAAEIRYLLAAGATIDDLRQWAAMRRDRPGPTPGRTTVYRYARKLKKIIAEEAAAGT